MQLKAIAFDLDGTLYPEYRILLPTLRVAVRHPRFLYYFSRVRQRIRSVFPIHDFKKVQAELMARFLRKSSDEAAALIEKIIYEKWLNAVKNMRPYSGLREIIIALKNSGYKTALLSDLPIAKKVAYLNLENIWDCAFSSEETGYLKPNAAPFQRLISSLNVKPAEIIYIGNNYRYDVLGARSLGIKTGYFSHRLIGRHQADYAFRHISELKKFLWELIPSSGTK